MGCKLKNEVRWREARHEISWITQIFYFLSFFFLFSNVLNRWQQDSSRLLACLSDRLARKDFTPSNQTPMFFHSTRQGNFLTLLSTNRSAQLHLFLFVCLFL
jgi:hypothetical protein